MQQPSSLAAECKVPVLLITKLTIEHDPEQDLSPSKPHNHLPKIHPGINSASNRNEYQEHLWLVKGDWPAYKADSITTNCVENVGASTSPNPRGFHDLLQGQLHFLPSTYSATVTVYLAVVNTHSSTNAIGN
jgi:hypothetical protein